MIDILIHVPSFVKIAICFASILAIYRIGMPLGWSIIMHSIVLSLWTGEGLTALAWQAKGFVRIENDLLFIAILMLLYFTEALHATGRMQKTVEALKRRITSYRMLLGGLPALVGLLPMPGGALVSAPLVGSVDSGNEIDAPLKVAINYWFRHIWEYWWPLYPGVIVAMSYCGLSSAMYFLVMMPFTLVAVAAGYVFILRRVHGLSGWRINGSTDHRLNFRAAWASLGPIGLLVCISVFGSMILTRTGMSSKIANLAAMLTGIAVSLPWIFGRNTTAIGKSLAMFKNKAVRSVMVVVVGVLMFAEALKIPCGGAGATLVSLMRDEFIGLGVPIVVVMMVLPFVAGFVTGLAVGFTGSSFPLVFALLGPDPSVGTLAATTVFAYSFGYMGMLLSPVHICFVVTNEYFKTRIFKAYPYILWPVAMILVAALTFSGALYYFMK